ATGGAEFYLGDFIGLAMASNTGYAAWTDTGNGNQDIFFTSYSIDPAPEPLNDRFEPNDTPELDTTPTILGRVVQRLVPKLAVSPGDEDWFLVEAAATGELIASALVVDSATVPPEALQVELWDQTATTLLTTGSDLLDETGSVVGKEVRSLSDAGRTFLVRVVGADPSETVFYSLRVQSLTADLGTRAFVTLDGTLAPEGGALYLVSAAAPGSIDVQLTGGDNVEGDLNLQMLDPENFAVMASGQAPPGPAGAASSAEPNDSIGEANPTALSGLGSVSVDSIIGDGDFGDTSGDVDFFSFEAGASQKISVNVHPLGSGLDSMIALYDSAGTPLEVVDSTFGGDDESLTFVTEVPDTYFLAVMDWAAGLPSDPFTPGTGAGVDTTGAFRVTITTEAVGPGAVEQASLPVQQGQSVLLLVSGEDGSSGDFSLTITNLDQFTTPENATLFFPAGAGPSEVAVGDLDADGNPDVVVTNALSNTVSVMLGNGDGTFHAPRQFAVGAFATPNPVKATSPTFGRDVAIADFDGDDVPDVAVTNYDSSDVSVLLGRGDGTFEPQRRFDATQMPFTLDASDLNGDGAVDLVVVDAHAGPSTAAILLGRGDGTFEPQRTFLAPIGASFPEADVRIADLDGDGRNDLLMAGSNQPFLYVLIGNGDGTFRSGGSFRADRPGSLAVTDLNGDGNLDVVSHGIAGPHTVSVLLGDGDGTFQDFQQFFAGQGPVDVAVVDLGSQIELPDGATGLGPRDGHPDVVVTASGFAGAGQVVGGPEVVVLPAIFDEQGQYVELGSPQQLAPARLPTSMDAHDVNGDGVADLAVVDLDGVLMIFGEPPAIVPNDTPETARDLGTVVHLVDQTQTIVPGHEDAYYALTVPTEAVDGAGDEVIDFSLLFQHTEGPGLEAEVLDAAGNVLGSGERFRVLAHQGEQLLLHVFGIEGSRGYGAFTPVIDVLPQVVTVEPQALLPGADGNPGGPTTSLVLTFQGDRLDPATAEAPANYMVTYLGPDRLAGTADDQVIPIGGGQIDQPIVYNPGANIEPTSGLTYRTAVRQTVTLLFADPLPAGSYLVELAPGIQTAAFNEEEASLLAGGATFSGHPVVSLEAGQLVEGSRLAAVDLVLESVSLGDLGVFKQGTPFLTQLHDDLGALLDAFLTEQGDDPAITPALIDQVMARFDPALGPLGERTTAALVIWLDPFSFDLTDPDDQRITYDMISEDPGTDPLIVEPDHAYVDVSDNIEVIVIPVPYEEEPEEPDEYVFLVSEVPETARGGVIYMGGDENYSEDLTDDLRDGVET
ncbi:MAG: FG-GAP-like repeat-containing protein, partial [Planctomycetota bacterium]